MLINDVKKELVLTHKAECPLWVTGSPHDFMPVHWKCASASCPDPYVMTSWREGWCVVLSASSVPSIRSGPHHQFRGGRYLNELVEDKGPSGHTAEGRPWRPSFDKENRRIPAFKIWVDFHIPSKENTLKVTPESMVGALRALSLTLCKLCLFHCFTRFSPHAGPDGSDCKVSGLPPKAAWQNFLLISAFIITTIILIINKPLTPLRNKHKWQEVNAHSTTHVNKNPGRPATLTTGCSQWQRTFSAEHGTWLLLCIVFLNGNQ